MTTAAIDHIRLDDQGVAWIDNPNTKVIEVVLDQIAYGWSPDEIHFQQRHLSLGQIHAALSYYHDHQQELDAEIERRYAKVQRLRAQARPSLTRRELEQRLTAPKPDAEP